MKKFNTSVSVIAMILIAAVIGSILLIVRSNTREFISELLVQQAEAANSSFSYAFERYQEEALERAEMIAKSKDIINAVKTGDSDALLSALQNYSVGLDLITLCDAEGLVLARTHNDKTGDSVLSQKAIATAINTGTGIKTIEQGTVIGLSTRGSAAIKDEDGTIIGALTCGHDLSQTKYIDAIKEQNDCEATFFAGDERMNTTLIDENGNRVIGTKASDTVIQTVLTDKKSYSGRIELFGSMYQTYYTPVIIDNQAIGMLFTGVHIDDALTQEQQLVVMITIAAIMLIFSVAITFFLIQWTSKRAHWYEGMLDSIPFPISVTDINMKWTFINKPVEEMLGVKRASIIGKHCSNWGAGICNTDNCGVACLHSGKSKTFFEQAGMDFSVDVSYLFDKKGRKDGHIEIVQDISEIIRSQKAQAELVSKIDEVTDSFIAGTKQVADGAHALSQGSTEQAAAVEQLSASISEIARITKDNADTAGKAAQLADTIKGNAEKGNHQMDEMMSAVKEINDASQNISKVIKVIDDIAFQTNILALNAAVEAARAGQHGKGFAVVAEEVRNLAAKSADAAKDTGSLIANSMEKAELGARIANETAVSLKEIVSGINQSSQLVGEIAKSSELQSHGIAQISNGVDQVAQVVQQTSATAQESAATSEYMSGQASMLGELVSQFNQEHGNEELIQPESGKRRLLPGS